VPRNLIFVLLPALACVSLGAQARAKEVASVYAEALPAPLPVRGALVSVHGVLFGQPFVADDARINSYCLILRQRHKIYTRVVLNFSAFQRAPAGQEFFSRGTPQPKVEVYQRLKNGEKLRSKIYCPGDTYALHVKFAPRQRVAGVDTTPGAILLRFGGGDFIAGNFVARQSPRVIWDDEAIVD
jgi:hypothetical protein